MVGRLHATTVPVATLDAAQRQRMWELFDASYADVDPRRFQSDLDGKDDVFLLWDGAELRGFSTVCRHSQTLPGGGAATVVYSGDTVIDGAYHGQNALQWAFFRYIALTRLRHPTRPVVWFLISKGYKTYLLLSRNFPCHWPRAGATTPPWAKQLIDTLATERFGSAYDPGTGTLRFEQPMGRLRAEVAPIPDEAAPDIRFFVQRNPGHADGEELCCIGLVDARLMLTYPFRAVRRVLTYALR